MAKLTPMMEQYFEIKKNYQDCILFYRLGDFYEMFYDDAKTASQELEITLTGKDCGQEERAPMCGVPYHSCEIYLNRLIEKGYKVAICEQVEDPKKSKGIVKRDVIRIVTPGTNMSSQTLDESKNNYLMAIFLFEQMYGMAIVDISTGEFKTTQFDDTSKLLDEIYKFSPAEIICNEAVFMSTLPLDFIHDKLGTAISRLDSSYFDERSCQTLVKEHFQVEHLEGLGLQEYELGSIASGVLLKYLYETQKSSLNHLITITPYSTSAYMILDNSTRRNLELCETLREKQKKGSLLWVLDKTKTAMGARLLRNYLEQPLISKEQIEHRFTAVESLCEQTFVREEIREYLRPIYDMERLMTRITFRTANPRDLISFKTSLQYLPYIKQLLGNFSSGLLHEIDESLDPLQDLYQLIESSILDDPPISIREGGIIKDQFREEIDILKKVKTDGKQWLADLEAKERERTGIKNLKIKYNKVFGYYLEVTNSYRNLVPDDYIRRQTLTNAERYTTEELNKLAGTILGAEDKLCALEYDTFVSIRDTIAEEIERVQRSAHAVAQIDVFASLALVAERNQYVRPKLNQKGILDVKDGRHPVVEQMIDHDMFVTNDTYLDQKDHRISIITGPNMAGKSTYMRQTALIVLMAQIGSFVPAKEANIGIVDRIFTRVGASDDLASGQSTFMVEMSEVANILRNATKKSLLILDEIGRGTSTFDGLSIAWAVVEYIANAKLLGAKTLFATHYHELTELEGKLAGVNNYCIAVKEQGDDIIFLRKIIKGGADKSYGIQVARLAGIPELVIERAKEIVAELTDHDIANKVKDIKISKKLEQYEPDAVQLSLFPQSSEEKVYTVVEDEVLTTLKQTDLSHMTPLEAMNLLFTLQGKLS